MKFLCPNCGAVIDLPFCCGCGHSVEIINNIWQMTDKPNINIDADSQNKYIGYDKIGENFEPERIYHHDVDKFRLYAGCSKKIVELFGKNITVLDLGAGLGSASIPLSEYGVNVIAADISQNMLEIIQKRMKSNKSQSLICCRMNAYELPIPNESIDIIVENAMLHLVDNPRVVIKEIVRVLKPNGVLIRYSSFGISDDAEKYKNNDYCNNVLKDILDYYAGELGKEGYHGIWFENHFNEIINEYFEKPYNESTDLVEEFTEKMKFRIHRLENKAFSGYQHVPNEIHTEIWNKTNLYAINKYGTNYRDIPNYSKYSATLDIYKKK